MRSCDQNSQRNASAVIDGERTSAKRGDMSPHISGPPRAQRRGCISLTMTACRRAKTATISRYPRMRTGNLGMDGTHDRSAGLELLFRSQTWVVCCLCIIHHRSQKVVKSPSSAESWTWKCHGIRLRGICRNQARMGLLVDNYSGRKPLFILSATTVCDDGLGSPSPPRRSLWPSPPYERPCFCYGSCVRRMSLVLRSGAGCKRGKPCSRWTFFYACSRLDVE